MLEINLKVDLKAALREACEIAESGERERIWDPLSAPMRARIAELRRLL